MLFTAFQFVMYGNFQTPFCKSATYPAVPFSVFMKLIIPA